MSTSEPKWGIVCTTNAPQADIERFAAHHLELGASRLYIYLDADDDAAFKRLKSHPKIRPFRTHGEHWRSKRRPEKHQVRQTANASHAYRRKAHDVDWLAHIDTDEFLYPHAQPIAEQLAALPQSCITARVRPIEALSCEGTDAPDGFTYFKAMTNERRTRIAQSEAIFPTYGAQLNGGFLSHVAGKIFVRTTDKDAAQDVQFKIHNVFISGEQNPGQEELLGTELCHMHAESYEHWIAHFRYRLAKGVYRAELGPNKAPELGGLTMNELLTTIEQSEGEDGLKAFYHEVCTATPELREKLDSYGLLRAIDLELETKRAKHFGKA